MPDAVCRTLLSAVTHVTATYPGFTSLQPELFKNPEPEMIAIILDSRRLGSVANNLTAMIEAAEQCERTALPQIVTLTRIEALLQKWPAERTLYFCDERGGEPFLDAITAGPGAVLIGPEGGFTDSENAAIRAHPNARPVSLGPRILRADTAAVTAISVWMAKNGDWSA